MFGDVLFGILPLFLIMIVGYAASHASRFADNVEPALNTFVFYIALPALLFTVVADADPQSGVPLEFLLVTTAATTVFAGLVGLLTRYVLRRSLAQSLAMSLSTGFGNVSYLGIPVVLGVLGSSAGLAAGMGQLVHNVLFMVGFPVLAQLVLPTRRGDQRRRSARTVAMTVRNALLRNPVTWAMLAGGAVLYFDWSLPDPVDRAAQMLAAAAAPGALFTIGLSLRRTVRRIRGRAADQRGAARTSLPAMVLMVLGKLLLLPALTVASLLWLAPDLDPLWFNTAVLMAAMPVSATAYIMAASETGDGEPTAVGIVLTSALAVLTLPTLAQLFLR